MRMRIKIKKVVAVVISALLLLALLLAGSIVEYFLYILGFIGIAIMIFCFFSPNSVLLLVGGLTMTLVALYFLKIK